MANPSISELHAQFAAAAQLVHKVRINGTQTTTGIAALQDTLVQSLEGDYADELASAASAFRKRYAGGVDGAAIRALLDPIIKQYGILIASQRTGAEAIFPDLYDYFVANSLAVQTRAISFGATATGGSNVGNGVAYRNTKDWNDEPIEAVWTDTVTIECIRDANMGASAQQEQWRIYGQTAGLDNIGERGSGLSREFAGFVASDSTAYITNPAFNQQTPTPATATSGATLTALTSWTVTKLTGTASFTGVKTAYSGGFISYRASGEGGDEYSVRVTQDKIIKQVASGFEPNVAYYVHLAYRPVAADGTLSLTLGDQSTSIALSGGISGWNTLVLGPGDENWGRVFNAGTQYLQIKLSGNSTGSVDFGETVIRPFEIFNNHGWAVVGGSTPHLYGDKFTAAASGAAAAGLVQWQLWKAYNKYLPSTGASPTITEPTVT